MFNQASILLLIISFLNIVLDLFVFLKNPKGRTNISFALFSLFLLIWINASFFQDELSKPESMYFLLKLDFVAGMFAAFFLCLFCLDISKVRIASDLYVRSSLFIIPALISVLMFSTSLILSGYEISFETINPVFGSFSGLYDGLIGISLFLGISALAWKYNRSDIEDKTKFIYLFIGFALSAIIVFVTNIALTDYIDTALIAMIGKPPFSLRPTQ